MAWLKSAWKAWLLSSKPARRPARRPLQAESLEDRTLMAVVSLSQGVSVPGLGDIHTYVGYDDATDTVVIQGWQASERGTYVGVQRNTGGAAVLLTIGEPHNGYSFGSIFESHYYPAGRAYVYIGLNASQPVSRISFTGLGGNDDIWNLSDIPLIANGGRGRDTFIGGSGRDQLFGGEHEDYLVGGGDNDYLVGGDGSDKLFGNAGEDALFGGPGSDLLEGGTENDYLAGEGGNDTLRGGAGNDNLFGGTSILVRYTADFVMGNGADLVWAFGDKGLWSLSPEFARHMSSYQARFPREVLLGAYGGTLFDIISADNATTSRSIVSAGLMNEWANLGIAMEADQLEGNDGEDLMVGGTLSDTLLGGNQVDQMFAGAGVDYLNGGMWERDYVYGGLGRDTIVSQYMIYLASWLVLAADDVLQMDSDSYITITVSSTSYW